jgi:hypothetical protein
MAGGLGSVSYASGIIAAASYTGFIQEGAYEVCPSKWKDEGDQTLVNPGAKMVGKVHEALTGEL